MVQEGITNELDRNTFTHQGERTVVKALLAIFRNGQRGENSEGGENELHNGAHNAVEDKISEKNQKHICAGVAGFAALIPGGVAMILDSSRMCAEANSGTAVACKTVVLITSHGLAGFTGIEANNFCLDYLSANDKRCASQGLSGSNSKASITVRNTQTNPTCADYDQKCKEFNA